MNVCVVLFLIVFVFVVLSLCCVVNMFCLGVFWLRVRCVFAVLC